jgi:hypothetical protein
VVEGLLAFGLVLFTVALAVQALAYAHARSVAITAAQDGARAAAVGGAQAGMDRANEILGAAGGTADHLRPSVSQQAQEVTVHVEGEAPHVFAVSLFLPAVKVDASLPAEQYPEGEAVP